MIYFKSYMLLILQVKVDNWFLWNKIWSEKTNIKHNLFLSASILKLQCETEIVIKTFAKFYYRYKDHEHTMQFYM
jgi:hypothetical protein